MTARTAKEARAWLDYLGITVAQWSREHGFNEGLVHEVLSGRKRCLRGNSHNIAVALGMKDGMPTNRPARVPPVKQRAAITSAYTGDALMTSAQIIARHCTDRRGQPLLVLERLPLNLSGEGAELSPSMARAYAYALLQAAADCEHTALWAAKSGKYTTHKAYGLVTGSQA